MTRALKAVVELADLIFAGRVGGAGVELKRRERSEDER
jgi:hypothetical protein